MERVLHLSEAASKRPPARKGAAGVAPAKSDAAAKLDVVDDLPRPVPVSYAMLEVLETYLGPELDRMLGGLRR